MKKEINVQGVSTSVSTSLRKMVPMLFAIVAAMLVATIVLLAFDKSPKDAYGAMLYAVFGSRLNFFQMLATTTPLVFTGLAVAVAFQGGSFNIGAEGQLYVGGFVAVLVGIYVNMPRGISVVVCLLAGMVGGALWALIPAILKARWGAPEVVTTVMFNTIGVLLVDYFLVNFFQVSGSATETAAVQQNAQLPRIIPQSQLSYGFFIAIIMALLVVYLMKHTTLGLDIRALGNNINAAKFAGINVSKVSVCSMLLSGALAGMAGAVVCLGVYRRFVGAFSPGYGFDGIAVALLANNNPIGIIFSAMLFGVLRTGGLAMDRLANVPVDIVDVILGVMIFFIASPRIFSKLIERAKQRKRDKSTKEEVQA